VKPLFYSRQEDGALAFASEIAALRALGVGGGGDDLVALAQFLSFLWIPDPRTPHTDVRSLEPGQALSWSASGVRTFAYGEPFMPAPADGTDADARELGERFRAASRRQLLSDVPIGLMASGGVDSGLILSATHDAIARCFTITWPGESGREALQQDEAAVRDLERRFAVPVSYIGGATAEDDLLPSSGDLFADPAHGLTRLIARTARERGLKVLLSGQGGDELFGGYRRHSVAPILARVRLGAAGRWVERAVQRLPLHRVGSEYAARLLRALSEGDAFSAYMQLCTYSTAAERAAALDCTEAEVADEVVWQRHREVFERIPAETSLLRKFMALDLHVYLPGLGLAYVDRAGMEFGVEVRVPWLDLEFVRWTLSLPDEAIVRKGRGKWLPRSLAADVLDPNIANRPKRGFAAPAERVSAAVDTSGARGFRQGAYFGRAKKLLDAHLAGGAGGLRPDPRAAA
jgi:asparagine synthase (glutamine-hydrolysing)